MPQVAPAILRDEEPALRWACVADLEALLRAMTPLLKDKEERASLDGEVLEDRKGLDIRLVGSSFSVPLNSVLESRQNGTWSILAGGVLEALRERHSLTPPRFFDLTEVYAEAVKAVSRIAREGMTPKELDAFDVELLEATSTLKSEAAIAKATVNCYVDGIVKLLRAGLTGGGNG